MKKILLSISLVAAFFTSYAQISYTDLNPDSSYTIIAMGTYSADSAIDLDIDGDTVVDFYFHYEVIIGINGVTWKLQLHCTDTGNQAYWKSNTLSNGHHYIKGLSRGDSITKNVLFGRDQDPLLGDDADDNIVSAGDKYIGIRFRSKGKTYYGWILLNMSVGVSSGTMTVKSFAYNTTAEEGINAGDTCVATKSITTLTACDSVVWNNTTYYNSGTYTFKTTNSGGCDSIATLIFTRDTSFSNITVAACDSFQLGNTVYYQSGVYTQVLNNANTKGCDSVVQLNLTINKSTDTTLTITTCDSLVLNGITYKTAGNYVQHLTNAAGCDSTVNFTLVISNTVPITITTAACDSFVLNGITYTSTGTYMQTISGGNGCDSIITLNLTVNHPVVNSIARVACDSFTLNGITYTSSGTYTQKLTTVAGCDSTINLSLTINKSTSSTVTTTGCVNYILNGVTYDSSGTYTQILTNAAGCDSVVTLVLTLTKPNISVSQVKTQLTANATGVAYQWLDCNANFSPINGATNATYTATANGSYAVEITDGNCVDTSSCIAVISVGIENNFPNAVKAYPNPTNGSILLSLGETYTKIEVKISNLLGKEVYKNTYSTAKEIPLAIDGAEGIYIISIRTATHSTKIKVLKQ